MSNNLALGEKECRCGGMDSKCKECGGKGMISVMISGASLTVERINPIEN